MKVKLHNALHGPLVVDATSVVVEDEKGNVIFAGQELGHNGIKFTHMDDPNYHTELRELGINKTVLIQDVKEQPLSNVIWTP